MVMERNSLNLLSLVIVFLAGFSGISIAETLFYDDFEDGKIDAAWEFIHGDWVEENGVLSQLDADAGIDPVAKAIIQDKDYLGELTIQAKVRVDKWSGSDPARGGVALRTDVSNGHGFNLLFRAPSGQLWFLDDFVVWGNSVPFDWEEGEWYYFQMYIDEKDEMSGKTWADGTAEPEDYMLDQEGWIGRSPDGPPGLNGGNTGSAMSFDEVEVWDAQGPTPKAVFMSSEKLTVTWGSLKSSNR